MCNSSTPPLLNSSTIQRVNMKKGRIFSGIQPTGVIHLGNYVGAIQQWVKLMHDYDCIYCIVDYHAMTLEYEVQALRDNITGGGHNASCLRP